MKIQCTLTFEYKDARMARMVCRATKVDDMEFVRSEVRGKQVEAVITSSSLSSLLHTLDDYLACVSVAETVGE